MATWPSYAGLKLSGFSIVRQSAVSRVEMESGPPKQAKILSRVLLSRQVTVTLETLAEYTAFITWFTTDIDRGADWFDWVDPVDGVTKQARIAGGVLTGETPAALAGPWEIGLTLETWDA